MYETSSDSFYEDESYSTDDSDYYEDQYSFSLDYLLESLSTIGKSKIPKLSFAVDIDQTLLFCYEDKEPDYYDFYFTFYNTRYYIKVRNGANEFLDFLSETGDVYLFTKGTREYARCIMNYFNTIKLRIVGFFARNDLDYNDKKNLEKISDNMERTVIFDDHPNWVVQTSNVVPVAPFTGECDNELNKMIEVVKKLKDEKDVRRYIQRHFNNV